MRRWSLWMVLLLSLFLAGCFFWRPSTANYSVSWEVVRPGGSSSTGSTMAAARILPWEEIAYAESGNIASGYWSPDTNPFAGYTHIILHAWKHGPEGKVPAVAEWSLEDETAGELIGSRDTRAVFAPSSTGETRIRAVIDNTVIFTDIIIYPGFTLDNGEKGYPNSESNRGRVGFSFATESYVTDRAEADIYIDSEGTVRAPGGVILLIPGGELHQAYPVPDSDFDTAATNIGFGGKNSADGREFLELPSMPRAIYVIRTKDGKQVAIDTGPLYASSEGYRAYGFGYRVLD